jgi:alkylated DNA repair protein (DNA oxidative demethylase)
VIHELAPGAIHLAQYLSIERQRALVNSASPCSTATSGLRADRAAVAPCTFACFCPSLERQDLSIPARAAISTASRRRLFRTACAAANAIAADAGMTVDADLCILNYYDADGRMGLHQDKDETDRSIAAGLPVVSISLGDTARFLFGGTKRRDPVDAMRLESGDAFVFGGAARLRFHGVSRILPGTAPPQLGIAGRFNLTFRQYDL